MNRKAALFGFLVVQAIAVALYVTALAPHVAAGKPLISAASEGWSGGGYSDLSSNFRTGSNVVLAQPYNSTGPLMWATLLWLGAGLASIGALLMFRAARTWIAITLAAAALGFGAGGAWMIATQWSGDTSYPPGFVSVTLLYALSKAFNTQFLIGFTLMALATVAAIAGIATKEKPYGFHFVALNWVIVAATWLVSYLVLYVAPPVFAGA